MPGPCGFLPQPPLALTKEQKKLCLNSPEVGHTKDMFTTVIFGLVGKAISFLIFGPVVIVGLILYVVFLKAKK